MERRNYKKTGNQGLLVDLSDPNENESPQETKFDSWEPEISHNRSRSRVTTGTAARGNAMGSASRGRGRPVWVHGGHNQNAGRGMGLSNSLDLSSKDSWRTGRPFSGSYKLSTTYGQLKQRVAEYSEKLPKGTPVEDVLFDRINRQSGAFIPRPENNNSQVLYIWGNQDEVRVARNLIMQLVAVCTPASSQGKKKGHSFAKIVSYSEQKEARLNQIEKHSTIMEQLRLRPDPSIKFPESMIFLWPIDELPLESSLGPQLEALDSIRRESGCHIYIYDEMPTYIRVDGYDHDTIIKVVHRLRAKWAELMATMHVKIKLYLVQPPPSHLMNNEVEIVRTAHSSGGFAYSRPLLFDTSLNALPPNFSGEKEHLVRAKNENRLRDAVERSLQGLRFLRGHVRMRVNFGTFVLDDYRVPKDSKARYPFEEFRAMLFHPRTKGHLVPGLEFQYSDKGLLAKCMAASDIFTPYEATAMSLEDAEVLHAVNFEFQGQDSSLLRLEAEFAKSPASGLFEVSQKRWIRPQGDEKTGDKRPPLQVAVIDFEGSDWQLEIKALEFQEPSSIDQSLRAFSHSIQFERGEYKGLSGEGRRRVTFSDLVPVARLVEKSALRYRLKGTNYIFELARYDEYRRVDILATQSLEFPVSSLNQMTAVPVTSWGASIFDLQWDNMLGQHANFRVGHTAEWSPSLNTFFPCCDDLNPSDLRIGFHQFIPLVKQVASLLGAEREKFVTKQTEKADGNSQVNANIPAASTGYSTPHEQRDVDSEVPKKSWANIVSA